jgi:hypothetical protein
MSDSIRLEYIKRYEEEERYLIYYGDKLLDSVIVVSHIARSVSFDYFDNDIDKEIKYDIYRLTEEYIMSEYKGYRVFRNYVYGNRLYWEWKDSLFREVCNPSSSPLTN